MEDKNDVWRRHGGAPGLLNKVHTIPTPCDAQCTTYEHNFFPLLWPWHCSARMQLWSMNNMHNKHERKATGMDVKTILSDFSPFHILCQCIIFAVTWCEYGWSWYQPAEWTSTGTAFNSNKKQEMVKCCKMAKKQSYILLLPDFCSFLFIFSSGAIFTKRIIYFHRLMWWVWGRKGTEVARTCLKRLNTLK